MRRDRILRAGDHHLQERINELDVRTGLQKKAVGSRQDPKELNEAKSSTGLFQIAEAKGMDLSEAAPGGIGRALRVPHTAENRLYLPYLRSCRGEDDEGRGLRPRGPTSGTSTLSRGHEQDLNEFFLPTRRCREELESTESSEAAARTSLPQRDLRCEKSEYSKSSGCLVDIPPAVMKAEVGSVTGFRYRWTCLQASGEEPKQPAGEIDESRREEGSRTIRVDR
jgi:hypothetical protein